jgi:glycosyltransferase involved in cell wall biosynthesis
VELKKVIDTLSQYIWEILFVNDGSKDKTLEVIKELRTKDERVNYIDLSRNFGKENAMLAGFDYATGDCMIIMDADLQHPPHIITDMLAKWEEGFDDVYAKRLTRGKESWLRKKMSLFFYKILQRSTRIEMLPNVGDFRLLDRKCINALKQLRESERYTKGLFCWIGFKKTFVEFQQKERVAGNSSWNFINLLGLGVEGIVSFSTSPLRISTILGLIVSMMAIMYMICIIIKAIFWGETVAGYPTILSCILFLGGIQLLCLGIIGEYIARIFNESKNRPIYMVREYNGLFK